MNAPPVAVTFLLIDVECTCNDAPAMPHEDMELIEIGGVVGSLTATAFTEIETLQYYVKPVWNPQLTPFCTQLTGISQSQVDAASLVVDALAVLSELIDKYSIGVWGSWGKLDHRQFAVETQRKQLVNPLAPLQHLNIKQVFNKKYKHWVGLARAVQMSGLNFAGSHHSGRDDAINIARIIQKDPVMRAAILQRVNIES